MSCILAVLRPIEPCSGGDYGRSEAFIVTGRLRMRDNASGRVPCGECVLCVCVCSGIYVGLFW